MNSLYLVFPTIEYEVSAKEFINEFIEYESELNGGAGLKRYLNDYNAWLAKVQNDKNATDKIPASTYFAIRDYDKKIVGTINIRHEINEVLLKKGGHIGFSVRPTERQKGYATEILFLGLKRIRDIGIEKVLVTCDKDNIGSAKTIQRNYGILEDEIFDKESNKMIQRYWINVNYTIEKRNNEVRPYCV
jgi:predicted acetyltransferase